MPELFTPISFRGLTLKNRIGMPPMCMVSAEDGIAGTWHVHHYAARAAGGTGLIIVEATAVEERGQISPGDLGIWRDDHIDGQRRVVDAVHECGGKIALQLAHAGRKAKLQSGVPVGPSPLRFSDDHMMPDELSISEIGQIQSLFVAAAERAEAAGFDAIEIHGAHGYLLSSFLSPLANQRDDGYGGSFENRTRFLMDTTRMVRNAWPEDRPLFVRLSSVDWHDKGWQIEDTVKLAPLLHHEGVDLIDCSSGGNDPEVTAPVSQNAGAGYQVPFARAVMRDAGVPSAAVGLITDPHHAAGIIEEGSASIVLLGRELLRNPSWAHQAADELEMADVIPRQYRRAFAVR